MTDFKKPEAYKNTTASQVDKSKSQSSNPLPSGGMFDKLFSYIRISSL